MKKFLAMILALVMALSLVACGDKKDDPKTDDNQGDNPEVTEITNADEIADEMTSEDGKYEIAFVTDVGQLKDKSFNQGTFDGVKLYAANNGLSYKYYQPANVGDESDFILAVLGRHVVVDIVRIGVSGGPALLIVSVVGILVVVGLLITAGNEGQNHDESEKQRKKLLHSSILPYFPGRRRAALRFILKCGRTSSDSIAKAKGRIKSDSPQFYFFCDN